MSKYYTIILLLLFTNCKNTVEEVVVEDKVSLISRQWSIVNTVYVSGKRDIINDYSNYEFTFNENGTFIFSRIAAEGLKLPEEGTWEIEGDKIILNPGESENLVVFGNLTESTLDLVFVVKETFKGDISIKFELLSE